VENVKRVTGEEEETHPELKHLSDCRSGPNLVAILTLETLRRRRNYFKPRQKKNK